MPEQREKHLPFRARVPTLRCMSLSSATRCLLALCLSFCACAPDEETNGGAPHTNTMEASNVLGLVVAPADDGEDWILKEKGQEGVISSGSREALEKERLERLRDRYGEGHPNLSFPTTGGKQYWRDRFVHAGWRIQEHIGTGHFRLLDKNDIRRAWGSWEACRTAFEKHRIEQGLSWSDTELVVHIHGILRAKESMATLQSFLQDKGYQTIALNYASGHDSLSETVEVMEDLLNDLHGIERLHFVTHSMGSLVLRMLLDENRSAPWKERMEVGRLVFVFPPSQGSGLAERLHDIPVYQWVTGEAGQELRPEHVKEEIPVPEGYPIRIIAGTEGFGLGKLLGHETASDGTLRVEETYLPEADMVKAPAGHSFGLGNEAVHAAVLEWLEADKESSSGYSER